MVSKIIENEELATGYFIYLNPINFTMTAKISQGYKKPVFIYFFCLFVSCSLIHPKKNKMANRLVTLLAITLITMQSMALAHFTLTYPTSRGFEESKEPLAPCGGFDTPSAQRIQLPLKSAFVQIDSGHTAYSFVVNALAKNDPINPDFISSNLVQVAQGGRTYPQAACLPLTFNDSFKPNTNVTIQVAYNGGDGSLYQVKMR